MALTGNEGAKAVSVHAFGEKNISDGLHTIEEKDTAVTIDGAEVNVHSQNPSSKRADPNRSLCKPPRKRGSRIATVTAEAPEGAQTSTEDFLSKFF
ncbi:MAG: hypothetical protein M3299_07770 [Thermoproteota archaeon]|nr:hypothetical protein [Thermoproteota archaeon]